MSVNSSLRVFKIPFLISLLACFLFCAHSFTSARVRPNGRGSWAASSAFFRAASNSSYRSKTKSFFSIVTTRRGGFSWTGNRPPSLVLYCRVRRLVVGFRLIFLAAWYCCLLRCLSCKTKGDMEMTVAWNPQVHVILYTVIFSGLRKHWLSLANG